jgi:dipeptidyl aminopeptidase/acylaminoacyl peptidase
MARWVPLIAILSLVGCKQSPSSGGNAPQTAEERAMGGVGAQLLAGKFTDLRVTPDDRFATAIRDPLPPRLQGAPPKMRVGELWSVDLSSGDSRKLGEGVTNMPGGYLFSPDSHWAVVLAGYNAATQEGSAQAIDLTKKDSKPAPLGAATGFFTISPDSSWVAFVDGGALKAGKLGATEFTTVGTDVSTAQFSPDSRWLVFRRRLSSAGALMVWRVDSKDAAAHLADNVGEYVVSPDSARVALAARSQKLRDTYDLSLATLGKPVVRPVATGVSQFAFSKDGHSLVRIEGVRPDDPLGSLVVGPSDGSPGKALADKVQNFEIAPSSDAVAALAKYDLRQRWGTLQIARFDGKAAQTIGEKVTDFDWDESGHFVAFSARVLKPIFSVNLFLYGTMMTEARTVGEGVFGFGFTPKGRLLYRTHCVREGRGCELDVLDALPTWKSQALLDGVYSFKPSEDGNRALLSFARTDADAYDTGVVNLLHGEHRTLDTFTVLPAHFAAKDGSRAVYLIDSAQRQGLFLAKDLP